MADRPESRIEVEPAETSSQFRRIVVDSTLGYTDSLGLSLSFSNNGVYNEVLSSIPSALHKKKLKRIIECKLIMSPTALRDIHRFLGEQISQYGALYGKIPSDDEIESRRKKYKESRRDQSQIGLE